MKEQLFDQMTSIGMAYVLLSQAAQSALNQDLTEAKLNEAEGEARRISGMNSDYQSERSYLAPLIESFFFELKNWLQTKSNGPVMADFVKMLNAEISKTFEERYQLDRNKEIPRWHQQVLEIGNKLINIQAIPSEHVASLLRNIPEDTTFGYLAILFLTESFEKSPTHEKLSRFWSYLSGEKPFICKVEQKGLYSSIDFLPA